MSYNPLLKPYCWINGHEWVDDVFMGDGKECERCGKMNGGYTLIATEAWHGGMILAFIVGVTVGISMGLIL